MRLTDWVKDVLNKTAEMPPSYGSFEYNAQRILEGEEGIRTGDAIRQWTGTSDGQAIDPVTDFYDTDAPKGYAGAPQADPKRWAWDFPYEVVETDEVIVVGP